MGLRSQNLGFRSHNLGLRGKNDITQTRNQAFEPDFGHFAWIWPIMLRFGLLCLDLGHIAWFWAIWQNLGQNRPQRRRSPEDEGGMNRRTD